MCLCVCMSFFVFVAIDKKFSIYGPVRLCGDVQQFAVDLSVILLLIFWTFSQFIFFSSFIIFKLHFSFFPFHFSVNFEFIYCQAITDRNNLKILEKIIGK